MNQPDTLFQYLDISEFTLINLWNRHIFLNDPEEFNDVFEGSVSISETSEDTGLSYRRLSPKDLNLRISCFSEINNNVLMWSHYADSHRGLVLEYSTAYSPFSSAIPIKYKSNLSQDEYPDLFDDNQFFPWYEFKGEPWAYEKEWRIINHGAVSELSYPSEALKRVIFGINTDTSLQAIIINIVRTRYKDVVFQKAIKSLAELMISFEEIYPEV